MNQSMIVAVWANYLGSFPGVALQVEVNSIHFWLPASVVTAQAFPGTRSVLLHMPFWLCQNKDMLGQIDWLLTAQEGEE